MKQNWFYRLERKYGRYRIEGLMRYIVAIEIIGALIGIFLPGFYEQYLVLDYSAVFRGQIWRLFTFVFCPIVNIRDISSILFFVLMVYLYYSIGNTLEAVWGAFRFNCYFISGFLMSIIAGLILHIATIPFGGVRWDVGFDYINLSMFLAYAVMFPDVKFLIYFIIPVKVKWLAILDAVFLGASIILSLMGGITGLANAISIIVSMLNFIIFIFMIKNPKQQIKTAKRKREFNKQVGQKVVPLFRHRCAICGRTERDDENLEFRFCSKCDGYYEYCSDHIYTHEHVKK